MPPRFVAGVNDTRERLEKWDSTRKMFFKEDGSAYEVGDTFRQPDLAATLKRIAEQGAREFYEARPPS